jgi:PAS domain S-box-containing protein
MSQNSAGKSSLIGSLEGGQVPAFLVHFIEQSFDAIVAFNSNQRIVYWNPAAERLFGWKASEALGKGSEELFWPVDHAQDNDRVQMQFPAEPGQTHQGERLLHRKDGHRSGWSTVFIRFLMKIIS